MMKRDVKSGKIIIKKNFSKPYGLETYSSYYVKRRKKCTNQTAKQKIKNSTT